MAWHLNLVLLSHDHHYVIWKWKQLGVMHKVFWRVSGDLEYRALVNKVTFIRSAQNAAPCLRNTREGKPSVCWTINTYCWIGTGLDCISGSSFWWLGEGYCELAYPALSMLESTTEEKLDNLALEAGEQKKVCCFIKIEWKTCAISQQKFLKLRKHFLEKGERGLS